MAINKEDYLYISSLLRAREPRMLSRDKAERMLDAPGFEDAAKMLTDAEKRILATWIDLNATFYGCYEEPCLTKQLRGEPIPMPDRQ